MRYIFYLLMTFIAAFIGLFTFADQGTFDKAYSKIVGVTSVFSGNSKAKPIVEIERIAKSIIEDRNWNSKRINLFIHHWGGLDNIHQRQVRNTEWYRQFASLLRNKIIRPTGRRSSQVTSRDENKEIIFTLAVVVGVTQQYANHNNRTIVKRVPIVIKRVPIVTKVNANAEGLNRQATTKRTSIALNNTADSLEDGSSEGRFENDGAKEKQPLSIAKLDSTPIFKPRRLSTTRSKPKVPASQIKETDIDDILESYSAAYKSGDTDGLIELFVYKRSSSEGKKIRKLKANFAQQFKGSNDRFVEFSDLYWQFDADSALGTGDYFAINELKSKKGTRTFDAKVNIELKWDGNQVRIANFQLIDLKVKVIQAETSLSSTKPFNKRRSARSKSVPTAAELYEVVNRYVGAFEEGDIATLESLFSYDAKMNRHSDLKGIKQKFIRVFSKTEDRQLFIQDLKWSFEDDYAEGIGNVKSLILPNYGSEVESRSGKIQIIAKKINNRVYITHLYRTEHKD